jgi:hypothetical protein
MDVDASQRRPDGGRRGSAALAERRRLMEKPTELYSIQEPEAPADSNVFQLSTNVFQLNAIRSYEHGLVFPRPLGAPWPRQVDWRAFLNKSED